MGQQQSRFGWVAFCCTRPNIYFPDSQFIDLFYEDFYFFCEAIVAIAITLTSATVVTVHWLLCLLQEVVLYPEAYPYRFRLFTGEPIEVNPDGTFSIDGNLCNGDVYTGVDKC